jgi:hypothetical protein
MADNVFDLADDRTISPAPMRMPVASGTAGAASIPTVAAASLIQEPEARIRYYSQQMGIPAEKFGIADGNIVYQTPEGALQRVSPGFAREVAKGLGPSLPAAGSALGTLPGLLMSATPAAPAAIPTAIAGGTTGAMGGQYIRELLARQMAGQRISPIRVATEGAIDMAASLTGALIGKGLTRAAATQAAKQFKQALKTSAGDASRALRQTLANVNAQYGTKISLTPAELTGSADLIAAQKALTGDPRTGETMAQFAQERGEQIGVAASQMLESLAPKAGTQEATGSALAQAAGEAVTQLSKQRSAAAAPAYAKAWEAGSSVNLQPFDALLTETSDKFQPLKNTLKRIRANYTKPAKVNGETRPVIRDDVNLEYVQDNIKEVLDDEISIAIRSGANKKALRLQELQGKLLQEMDRQVPEYAGARKIWGDLSRPIDEVEGGILPILANKNIRDFEYMGARFLTSSSPAAIAQAKQNILKVEGGQDVWDATVRGALERQWEKANKVPMSYISRPDLVAARAPAVFWSNMVGNKEQLDRLKAAMSPQQIEAFTNLTKIMEAASRAMYTGSDTSAKESAKELLDETTMAGTAMKYALAPWAIPGAAKDAAGRAMSDANVKKLANVLTSSDAVEALAALRAGQGGKWFNERNMMIAGRSLAQAAMIGGELVTDFEDRPPKSILSGGAPSMTQGMINPFDM